MKLEIDPPALAAPSAARCAPRASRRILYFYQYFTTPKGAWSTRAYEFARRWVEAGDHVTIVTSVYDRSDLRTTRLIERRVIDGIDVVVVNVALSNKHGFVTRVLTFLAYALVASYYALRAPADIVLASSGPLTVALPALVARHVRRLPMVFEVRDLWPRGAIELGVLKNPIAIRLARWLERRAYAGADRIVALSEGMAEAVEASGAAGKVEVVPNASDNALFGARESAAPPPEIDPDRPLVVYTGTLGLADDCGQIVRIARALERRGRHDVQLAIVGDGKERHALQALAHAWRLNNLRFFGARPKGEVSQWLVHATCALVTFKAVPFTDTMSPNKMFDAFAAGVPVVQTTQGWIRRLLAREQAGLTVAADDPEDGADAIECLVDDSALRHRLSTGARRLARDAFDRDRLAAKMRAILHDASG